MWLFLLWPRCPGGRCQLLGTCEPPEMFPVLKALACGAGKSWSYFCTERLLRDGLLAAGIDTFPALRLDRSSSSSSAEIALELDGAGDGVCAPLSQEAGEKVLLTEG